jgi:VanZ family protein
MIRFFFSFPQFLRLFFSLLYLAVVLVLTCLPSKSIPQWDLFPGFDKLVHVCMYFGVTIMASWTFHAEEKLKRIIYIVLLATLWGLLMEFMQLFMDAGRAFEWMDELSNSAGVVTGAVLYAWMGIHHARIAGKKTS